MADKDTNVPNKNDFISREEVLELIDNAPIIAGSENETLISAPELSDKVYCLPAADVVEVVRCKDCYAYRRDPELAKAAYLDPEQYCALLRCEFPSDGFCFYGRRDDNG